MGEKPEETPAGAAGALVGCWGPGVPVGSIDMGGEGAAGPAGVLLPPAVVGQEPCNRRS